jgi:hypothetical protein
LQPPCEQTKPCPQATPGVATQSPAAPQCALSDCGSTHLPAQSISPDGHETAQVPFAQTGPAEVGAEQLTPQPPQFDGSLCVSTQAPLHWVSPLAQETTQAPPRHTSPAGHARELLASSHAPQLFRSESRFTHCVGPVGAVETCFQTTVPSVIALPVPAGPPLAADVPAVTHW